MYQTHQITFEKIRKPYVGPFVNVEKLPYGNLLLDNRARVNQGVIRARDINLDYDPTPGVDRFGKPYDETSESKSDYQKGTSTTTSTCHY